MTISCRDAGATQSRSRHYLRAQGSRNQRKSEIDSLELGTAWRETLEKAATPPDERPLVGFSEQFLVLVGCRDEKPGP